ncbi:hypothetical protein AB0M35_25715 [Micromonospora sp. NPDC051196]|uniref:hypothetical protein n=1 Tax=Micromonospora sp. NPDC051196 TaxID=3155281 RepID=UPI003437360C
MVVLDVDSTIVIAHSDKEGAAATYKHTYGFHPILVTCDNTAELLASKTGSAAPKTPAFADYRRASSPSTPPGAPPPASCTANAAAGCASPATWPWAEQIAAAFNRIAAIPDPG